MNISSVGMYNNCPCPDCGKKNAPAFGMAIRFKPDAIKRLKNTLSHSAPENMDTFSKEISPLIKKSEKNPVDVVIEPVLDNNYLLKATVMEDETPAAEFVQSDLFSYDFIKQGVSKADYLNKLNKELNGLTK